MESTQDRRGIVFGRSVVDQTKCLTFTVGVLRYPW